MVTGVRIALDVGSVRIGVAKCDPEGLIATPLVTVAAGAGAVAEIVGLIAEHNAICIYIGKPTNLAGKDTASTLSALEFARDLALQIGELSVSIRLIDERLSTVSAQRGLHEVGLNTKQSRDAIDQAAAVVILEHALASERHAGNLVGEVVI
jgi:putative Holliday junction resolvase